MKKLSILLLAAGLVLAFTLPAAAVDHIFGGYWRVRAFTNKNFSGQDDEALDKTKTDSRTRLYYTAKFSDTFQFVNKFEFDWEYGESTGSNEGSALGDIGADGTSFEIKNSYVDFWTFNKKLQWKIGAQGYTIGRGFLFSDDFSGLYVAYNGDGWKIPFIWIKGEEGGTGPNANDQDVDYYAINPAFKFSGVSVNPYFMMAYSDDATKFGAVTKRQMAAYRFEEYRPWWIGLDLDYNLEGWNLWATGIWSGGSGDVVTATGTQSTDFEGFLLGAGASGAVGPVGLHGQVVYSSGDDDMTDDKYEGFFVPYGASYYWAEIMGYGVFDDQYSNNAPGDYITDTWFLNAGVDYKLIESLKLGLDLWYASLTQKEQIGATDEPLGTEVDFSATWNIMPKLNLDFVAAYLFAGDGTYDGPNQKDPYEIGTRLSLSF